MVLKERNIRSGIHPFYTTMTRGNKNKNSKQSIVHEVLKESNSILSDFTSNLPPPSPSRGILLDIVCSIFEPGVNPGLRLAIHFSFLSLFAVHFWLIYLTSGRELFVWGLVALNLILYPCLLIFIELAYNQDGKAKNKTD